MPKGSSSNNSIHFRQDSIQEHREAGRKNKKNWSYGQNYLLSGVPGGDPRLEPPDYEAVFLIFKEVNDAYGIYIGIRMKTKIKVDLIFFGDTHNAAITETFL